MTTGQRTREGEPKVSSCQVANNSGFLVRRRLKGCIHSLLVLGRSPLRAIPNGAIAGDIHLLEGRQGVQGCVAVIV
jgi:hypothetical protein